MNLHVNYFSILLSPGSPHSGIERTFTTLADRSYKGIISIVKLVQNKNAVKFILGNQIL